MSLPWFTLHEHQVKHAQMLAHICLNGCRHHTRNSYLKQFKDGIRSAESAGFCHISAHNRGKIWVSCE